MATAKNWPFGKASGQKLTDYLTTGPVVTMSRKDIRATGFQKQNNGYKGEKENAGRHRANNRIRDEKFY